MYSTLIFPLTLLTIYNAQGLVMAIDVYFLVKFKFCAQPMHQICVIKHCILKLMDEKDRVISITSVAFTMIVSRLKIKHFHHFHISPKSTGLLKSHFLTLTAQPHQLVRNKRETNE